MGGLNGGEYYGEHQEGDFLDDSNYQGDDNTYNYQDQTNEDENLSNHHDELDPTGVQHGGH